MLNVTVWRWCSTSKARPTRASDAFLRPWTALWKKKKVCNQKTQTISRTQSKPNLLEGHNVFWGFIPLFFTYTVLSPARAELGFELNVARYHKRKEVQALCPECISSPRENSKPWKAPGSLWPQQPPLQRSFRASFCGLGVLTAAPSFPCYVHDYRCRRSSQQPLSSGNQTTGLVRKEVCQEWDKWTDFSRTYLPFSRTSVVCSHRADPCPLSLWKSIPQYLVHCVFTNSHLAI